MLKKINYASEILREYGVIKDIEFDILSYTYYANFKKTENKAEQLFPRIVSHEAHEISKAISILIEKNLIAPNDNCSYSFDVTDRGIELFTYLNAFYHSFSNCTYIQK